MPRRCIARALPRPPVTGVLPVAVRVQLRRPPVVSVALITANVLAWAILQLVPHGFSLMTHLALAAARPTLHGALASCFLHVNFWHVAGNMLYLAVFGPPLEDRIGRVRFLVLYLLLGMTSLFAQSSSMWIGGPADPFTVIVGSSGAIAGVLGLFLVRFPNAQVMVFAPPLLMGRHRVPGVGQLNAVAAIVAWLIVEVTVGFFSLAEARSAVAHWAHLSGFVLGAALGVLLRLPHAAHSERVRADASRAEVRGQLEEALGFWRHALALDGRDLEPWVRCARLAARLGRGREAREAYRAALTLTVERRWREAQIATYAELTHAFPDTPAQPALELALARQEEFEGRFEMAAAYLRRGAEAAGDDAVRAAAYAELARLHREKTGDRVAAADAEEEALRLGPRPARATADARAPEELPAPRAPVGLIPPHPGRRSGGSASGTISP